MNQFFFRSPIPLPSNISCINSFSYNLSVLSYKIPKGMTHLEELSFGKKLTFWQTLLAYFKLWKECFQHVRQSHGCSCLYLEVIWLKECVDGNSPRSGLE